MPRPRKTASPTPKDAQSYRHPDADLPARPGIGAQPHFKKAKAPATYRFDSSLATELTWDGPNPAREQVEAAIAEIEGEVSGFTFPASSGGKGGRPSQNLNLEARNCQSALIGVDTFDPVTMDADSLKAAAVPARLLDTDYNGMVFRVRQAFFPRTGAWGSLNRPLRMDSEGTRSGITSPTRQAPVPRQRGRPDRRQGDRPARE